MQRRDLGRLLLATTAPLAWPALADGFPQRPVKIVVPQNVSTIYPGSR
nr:hypothetical protein [Variovorax boronicumulans]